MNFSIHKYQTMHINYEISINLLSDTLTKLNEQRNQIQLDYHKADKVWKTTPQGNLVEHTLDQLSGMSEEIEAMIKDLAILAIEAIKRDPN